MKLSPPSRELFFTKNDPDDPRLGEYAQILESDELEKLSPTPQGSLSILGYSDDEGIAMNGGRMGASLAPDLVRTFLYRMTPSLRFGLLQKSKGHPTPCLYDLGNITKETGSLAHRHEAAFSLQQKVLACGLFSVGVGGGHDYGFADSSALCEHALFQGKTPVIVNFDAHLDVRPNQRGNNSGTSFFRLLEKYGSRVVFFEFGLQDWCNSTTHWQWAEAQGARLFSLNQFLTSGKDLSAFVMEKLEPFLNGKNLMGVSLDMDCFSSSVAPGASQVFPHGFETREFYGLWSNLLQRPEFQSLGIYELSPPFDHDSMSVKLAATLIHQCLFRRTS